MSTLASPVTSLDPTDPMTLLFLCAGANGLALMEAVHGTAPDIAGAPGGGVQPARQGQSKTAFLWQAVPPH